MFIVKCAKCGNEIIDNEKTCIQCNYILDESEIIEIIINVEGYHHVKKTNTYFLNTKLSGSSHNKGFFKAGEEAKILDINKKIINIKTIEDVYFSSEFDVFNLRFEFENIKQVKNIKFIAINIKKCEFDNIQNLKKTKIENISNLDKIKSVEPDMVKCPKCASTQIQIVPRKWSLFTGLLTNKVDRVCLKCKNKF